MINLVEIHSERLITSDVCITRINWKLHDRQVSKNDVCQPLDGNDWDIPMICLFTFSTTRTENKRKTIQVIPTVEILTSCLTSLELAY